MEIFYNIISKEEMGGNIPRAIKVNVIKEWLRGKSRDQIAKQEGIGAGTVSSIIQECRQNDTEFDLLRQVALELKNHGESIESFAPLVRLREVLKGADSYSFARTGTYPLDHSTNPAHCDRPGRRLCHRGRL